MALETNAAVDRAVRLARESDPPGWIDLTGTVMQRVRAVVLPSEQVLAFTRDGRPEHDAHGARTWLSARSITVALRDVCRTTHSAPSSIDLTLDEGRLVALDLALVAAYGTDLQQLAYKMRGRALNEIRALLGNDPEFGGGDIAITVVDVTRGNPNYE